MQKKEIYNTVEKAQRRFHVAITVHFSDGNKRVFWMKKREKNRLREKDPVEIEGKTYVVSKIFNGRRSIRVIPSS